MNEEREVPLVPDGPVELEPQPLAIIEPAAQQAALVTELERAGVTLGTYERGTVEWLCQRPGWGWGTVATIASWVRRAASKDVPALLAEVEHGRQLFAMARKTGHDLRDDMAALREERNSEREALARLRAELAARPSRADVLREAAVQMDEICEQHGVLGVGDRLRRLADRTDAEGGSQ